MNAIEYVKKVGFCEAKSVLLKSECHSEVDVYLPDTKEFTYISVSPTDSCPYVGLKGLREIVEAFEIIGLFKNLRHALIECDTSDSSGHSQILVKIEGGVGYIDVLRVRKAIFLVEQCNAKS